MIKNIVNKWLLFIFIKGLGLPFNLFFILVPFPPASITKSKFCIKINFVHCFNLIMKKNSFNYRYWRSGRVISSRISSKKKYNVYGILPRRSNPEFQTYRIENILKINLVYGDILDKITLDNLIRKIKPDEVYHLAAQSHGVSFKSPYLTTQIDYIGVINILDPIRLNSPKSKFYNASTSEIYGNANKNLSINEKSEKDPVSPYGISKLAAFYLTKVYRDSYNLFACMAFY